VAGVRLAPDGTLRVGDAGVRLTPEQALALAAQLQANAVLRLVPRPPRPVVTEPRPAGLRVIGRFQPTGGW
jgi:hypothetical protein